MCHIHYVNIVYNIDKFIYYNASTDTQILYTVKPNLHTHTQTDTQIVKILNASTDEDRQKLLDQKKRKPC